MWIPGAIETRGPGRVCLIASLVQVLVDPFYGTIAGFMQLIQKEWIKYAAARPRTDGEAGRLTVHNRKRGVCGGSAGFNFARATGKYVTNMGVRPPDDISGEEDPTFALFLDSVRAPPVNVIFQKERRLTLALSCSMYTGLPAGAAEPVVL